jgi:hypothetical protein
VLSPTGYPSSARVTSTQWAPDHLRYGWPSIVPSSLRSDSSAATRGDLRTCSRRSVTRASVAPSTPTRICRWIDGSSDASN